MPQAERQHWYANLTPEQREDRRVRQRVGFDHSETMSPWARHERARRAGLAAWEGERYHTMRQVMVDRGLRVSHERDVARKARRRIRGDFDPLRDKVNADLARAVLLPMLEGADIVREEYEAYTREFERDVEREIRRLTAA